MKERNSTVKWLKGQFMKRLEELITPEVQKQFDELDKVIGTASEDEAVSKLYAIVDEIKLIHGEEKVEEALVVIDDKIEKARKIANTIIFGTHTSTENNEG